MKTKLLVERSNTQEVSEIRNPIKNPTKAIETRRFLNILAKKNENSC